MRTRHLRGIALSLYLLGKKIKVFIIWRYCISICLFLRQLGVGYLHADEPEGSLAVIRFLSSPPGRNNTNRKKYILSAHGQCTWARDVVFGVMIDAETFRHIIDFTVASVGDSVDISPCIICPDVLLLEQHVFFPSRVRNDDLTRCSGQTLNIWFKMDEKKKKEELFQVNVIRTYTESKWIRPRVTFEFALNWLARVNFRVIPTFLWFLTFPVASFRITWTYLWHVYINVSSQKKKCGMW